MVGLDDLDIVIVAQDRRRLLDQFEQDI